MTTDISGAPERPSPGRPAIRLSSGPDTATDAVAAFLAVRPDTRARLLAEHRPDDRRRCRGCRTPGYGTPGGDWPCVIATAAQTAEDRAAEQASGPPSDQIITTLRTHDDQHLTQR